MSNLSNFFCKGDFDLDLINLQYFDILKGLFFGSEEGTIEFILVIPTEGVEDELHWLTGLSGGVYMSLSLLSSS